MYPSDYGFSTSGGNDNWKIHCLTRASMQSWGEGEALSWCAEFSWLYNNNNNQWTITSRPNNTEGYWVYFVNSDGNLTSNMAVGMEGIRPVVYLNSNIKISGEGSSSSPFQISVEVS